MLYHKLNIIKYGFKFCVILPLLIIAGAAGLLNCADIAPTIYQPPATELSPPENLNTLYPTIQSVYPGTLQTLDIPQSYPTNVDTSASDIIVVFTHEMENDNNEMGQSFALYENLSDTPTPISILPNASSRYFIISPLSGNFKDNSYYTLHIYKFTSVNDESDRILEFESLVELPASTLSPANPLYVEYTFRTGSSEDPDQQPPVLLATNPGNNEKDVDPGLSPDEYIEIVFLDNTIPMIYPPSVNVDTVILENVTDDPNGTELTLSIELDTDDTDFKTFKIYPIDNLLNGKNYKLTISAGNTVKDFQGNILNETSIFFNTAPNP